MSSFFTAGAFVDDTIWVGDCQASIQYALNIASEFFSINNIFINNEKTVAIPINQGVRIASLSISGQPIFIVKKGETHRYLRIFLLTKKLFKLSLAKAYLDIQFFVNVNKPATKLKTEIGNPTHQPTTSSLNLCSLYKGLNSKTFRYNQHTTPTTPIQTVAESEEIGTNHLGLTKSLFQHYCQHLGLTDNHLSAELAFNFYIHERISYLLGVPVETDSTRRNFYNKLIQNTSLPTNYNFTAILTKINKEIEIHTQQRYPITYANKGKEKLQTPAITPQRIQPPTWKKTRVESPTNLSYYYTPRSAINITGIVNKKKRSSRIIWHDFNLHYPNQILELQNNQNPNLINQPNLLFVIVINSPLVELIGQPLQQPHQQIQQLLVPLQQPPQPNLDPMAYAPIAKLEKFTGKEDDAQVWLNNMEKDTVDSWYQSLVNKPKDFNAFKIEFLRYFSNNNSINRLANTFTIIKQGENEAVTTYLGCFHRNLHQIQAINVNYFTVAQILNQFICRLCSSIQQHIHPMHLVNLQAAITNAKDFEATELEANYT
ncbi:hypothetical protein G9A89_007312 [Geosiphon pyriformis]|nr:hypothetical protein G9A89_007312 [Geosiphon pyriformis]